MEFFPDFPPNAITGSLGDLARAFGRGTEIPEAFLFVTALTLLGSTCAQDLTLDNSNNIEPRLFTILLGSSGDTKKSSAVRRIHDFFAALFAGSPPFVVWGVGSGEGLARELEAGKPLLLAYDELSGFINKTAIKGSSLLPMVTSLFEGHDWDNCVKDPTSSTRVRDARLSLIGCCTTNTYARVWTPESVAIGLTNRLFVVAADPKARVAWPESPAQDELDAIGDKITKQVKRLRGGRLKLTISEPAKNHWENWCKALPSGEHSRRIDTIGFRLMPLIALTTDKAEIDLETIEVVTSILDYELIVRKLTDPIDCDTRIAEIEEKIRRVLSVKPALDSELKRRCNYVRVGIYWFNLALKNLAEGREIYQKTDKVWRLVGGPK